MSACMKSCAIAGACLPEAGREAGLRSNSASRATSERTSVRRPMAVNIEVVVWFGRRSLRPSIAATLVATLSSASPTTRRSSFSGRRPGPRPAVSTRRALRAGIRDAGQGLLEGQSQLIGRVPAPFLQRALGQHPEESAPGDHSRQQGSSARLRRTGAERPGGVLAQVERIVIEEGDEHRIGRAVADLGEGVDSRDGRQLVSGIRGGRSQDADVPGATFPVGGDGQVIGAADALKDRGRRTHRVESSLQFHGITSASDDLTDSPAGARPPVHDHRAR